MMNNNFPLFILDRDGVLLEFEYGKLFAFFATIFPVGYNLPEIHTDILILGKANSFPVSDADELAFWQSYCDVVGERFLLTGEQESALRNFDYTDFMFRFDDTLPFLSSLKANGQQIAILSNNPMTSIHRALNRFGIGQYIDLSFAANEIGIAKPDPSIYQHVMKELQVAPETCVYIDDEPPCVLGAIEAGITQSYWLNRKGAANKLELAEITSLNDLSSRLTPL